jgi:hypothetical protein
MWKLNREIFPGDVQQRDAKLEYELERRMRGSRKTFLFWLVKKSEIP